MKMSTPENEWPQVGDVVAYESSDRWGHATASECWTVARRTPCSVTLHRGSKPEVKTIRGRWQIKSLLEPWTEEHEAALRRAKAANFIARGGEQIKSLASSIASDVARNRRVSDESLFATANAIRDALALIKKAVEETKA